jgi:hypothetical protein
MDIEAPEKGLEERLSDRKWRLANLYFILNKSGKKVLFQPNWAQLSLLDNLWYMNVILKARQLGFSTFIDIFILDCLLFNANKQAGIIAHTLDDAKHLFQAKVKFPYENLPGWLKEQVKLDTDSKTEAAFSNGSGMRVGTALRGGTFNYLHVSEFGEISHKFPDKAKEIVAGAFNTIQAGQMIFVESTHKGGKGGHFFDLCQTAMQLQGKDLSMLDFRFHFFPWYREPTYKIPADGVVFDQKTKSYLDNLEREIGEKLEPGQRAWYMKKKNQQGYAIYQEFPSTAEEAFMVEISGAFYAKQMGKARADGRVTQVPYIDSVPVFTFWDLGLDCTAIWFLQLVGREVRLINYYENSDISINHYVKVLNKFEAKTDCVWGKDFMPHDSKRRSLLDTENTVLSLFKDLGRRVERIDTNTASLMSGIEQVRHILPMCLFDAVNCKRGIEVLESYHQKWNDAMNCWSGEPVHDWASHGADAFRYLCVAIKFGMIGDNSTVSAVEAQDAYPRHHGFRPQTAIDDDYDPLYG